MAYTWPADPTVTYGTTYQSPKDTKQLILNGQDMESRMSNVINVRIKGGCAGDGTTDDLSKIQTVINASSVGDTLYFDRMFALGGSTPLLFKSQRRYLGSSQHSTGFVQTGSNNMAVMVADEGWYNNSTTASLPLVVEQLKFDGNKDGSNASGGTIGLVLMNFWAQVNYCMFIDNNGEGCRITSRNRGGTDVSDQVSEPRFNFCQFRENDGYGLRQYDPNLNKCADGWIDNCAMSGGNYGVHIQSAQGWKITNNHLYANRIGGIYTEGAYATNVSGNYVEGWGFDTVSSADKVGIYLNFANGPWPSTVSHNVVTGPEDATAGSVRGIQFYGVSGAITQVTIAGNTLYGGTSGDVALWVESQGGGGTVNLAGLNTNSISNFTQRLQINSAVTANQLGLSAYTAATGTATRSTFATSTVTVSVLAEHVKALIDDLQTLRILP